jgi:hypothetical protein
MFGALLRPLRDARRGAGAVTPRVPVAARFAIGALYLKFSRRVTGSCGSLHHLIAEACNFTES